MNKATRQKRKQAKEKDDKLWPEEKKVAKLYKAGKLKGKTFENMDGLEKDLNS